ncbi:MAG TPA: hypothetical protein VG815_17810 [Chloroflexota bacterium]|nr:hypothetical protein [Chloroflexota bacterium]
MWPLVLGGSLTFFFFGNIFGGAMWLGVCSIIPMRQTMEIRLTPGSTSAVIRSWAGRLIPVAGLASAVTLVLLVRRHAVLLNWFPSYGLSQRANSPLADILVGMAAIALGVLLNRILFRGSTKRRAISNKPGTADQR